MQEFNEAEMFRSVLNEMLIELKQLNAVTKETNKTLLALGEKVDGFEERLKSIKVEVPPADLGPVMEGQKEGLIAFNEEVKGTLEGMQTLFTQAVTKLKDAVEAQPKPIVRRICFFPENDYKGNYKYFIRAVVLWSLGVFAIVVLYSLGRQWFEQRGPEFPYHQGFSIPPDDGVRSGGVSSSGAVRHGKGARKRRHEVDSVGVGRSATESPSGDSVAGYYSMGGGDSVR